jgi:hypothetical protein
LTRGENRRAYNTTPAAPPAALGVEAGARTTLEMKLRSIFYEQVVSAALKDGEVSAGERRILNATRKLIGIPEETASKIEADVKAARGLK